VKQAIAIFEDEGITALHLRTLLTGWGYSVVAVEDTAESVAEVLESAIPDLVLMDIRLKGEMDGIDTAGVIRDRFNLPVVYLTAYTDPATLARAKVMEPFGYVVKPFETRSLMVSIEIALHRHRSESERIYREKLQAVLETVGAICHELNQPMMAISGHTELLMDTLDQDDPVYPKIAKIKSQVERMGAITQKLMGITRYETMDYAGKTKIIDIHKASAR